MDVQTSKGGFANNLTAQLIVLAAAVIIMLAVASRYMW